MARLSRPESQAQTREQVLQAAQRLFLHEGFGTTSLDRVADEAGYSKGAVYSNFATKTQLCLAVLDRIRTEQAAALLAEVGDTPDVDARIAGFARWADTRIGDPSWTALEVEFATSSRTDGTVRTQLAERRQGITAVLAQVLRAQADATGRTLTMPADTAAITLLSLGIGIGVQRAFDATVPVEPLVDMLRRVLGA